MTEELYYTSAPRGLQPGVSGFCTVARTRAMPAALQSRLEALSTLARPKVPGVASPVHFGYCRLSLQGQSWAVLSRVCDSGSDHTGRTNSFAHHLALPITQAPTIGPAALLARPGLLERAWTGEPRWLERGRAIAAGVEPVAAPCRAWERATGDAGWAGALAEWTDRNPDGIAYVVHAPEADVLGLFDEAIRLQPAARRWMVGFGTQPHPDHWQDYRWRAVTAGSAVARSVKAGGKVWVIDLTGPLEKAVGGALVEQARTGRRVERAVPEARKVPMAVVPREAPRGPDIVVPDVPLRELELVPDRAVPPVRSIGHTPLLTGARKDSAPWGVVVGLLALVAVIGVVAVATQGPGGDEIHRNNVKNDVNSKINAVDTRQNINDKAIEVERNSKDGSGSNATPLDVPPAFDCMPLITEIEAILSQTDLNILNILDRPREMVELTTKVEKLKANARHQPNLDGAIMGIDVKMDRLREIIKNNSAPIESLMWRIGSAADLESNFRSTKELSGRAARIIDISIVDALPDSMEGYEIKTRDSDSTTRREILYTTEIGGDPHELKIWIEDGRLMIALKGPLSTESARNLCAIITAFRLQVQQSDGLKYNVYLYADIETQEIEIKGNKLRFDVNDLYFHKSENYALELNTYKAGLELNGRSELEVDGVQFEICHEQPTKNSVFISTIDIRVKDCNGRFGDVYAVIGGLESCKTERGKIKDKNERNKKDVDAIRQIADTALTCDYFTIVFVCDDDNAGQFYTLVNQKPQDSVRISKMLRTDIREKAKAKIGDQGYRDAKELVSIIKGDSTLKRDDKYSKNYKGIVSKSILQSAWSSKETVERFNKLVKIQSMLEGCIADIKCEYETLVDADEKYILKIDHEIEYITKIDNAMKTARVRLFAPDNAVLRSIQARKGDN